MEHFDPTLSFNQDFVDQLSEWDKQYVWHPFTQMQEYLQSEPLIIAQGEGAYLIDVKGNRYFDGNSSLWLNTFGHRNHKITNAIKNQADLISHSTMLGMSNVPATLLAAKLVNLSPPGLEKVFYSDNGSTAGEVAVKMAFQYWRQVNQTQRTSFITFDNAYHGDTLGAVSMGGFPLFHEIFRPLLFQRYNIPYPVYSKYTAAEKPEQINARCLKQCEDILDKYGDSIAAVMIEPLVQGAAGILTQSPGFLSGLRNLCTQHGIFLIADEVFTGFGRTGTLFACEQENVTPDFMTLAKGITGGYLPLAATLTTQQVFDGFLGKYEDFRTFFHGHSYTGNQLGCAAGLANLSIFESENVLGMINHLSERLALLLDDLFETSDHIKDIHHIGLIAGIDLARSRSRKQDYDITEQIGAKVCFALRKHGIWLRPLGNTLVLVPPFITTAEELEHLVDSIKICLNELT